MLVQPGDVICAARSYSFGLHVYTTAWGGNGKQRDVGDMLYTAEAHSAAIVIAIVQVGIHNTSEALIVLRGSRTPGWINLGGDKKHPYVQVLGRIDP